MVGGGGVKETPRKTSMRTVRDSFAALLLALARIKATRNLAGNWMRCACHGETVSVIFLTRHAFRRYHYLWYTPEIAHRIYVGASVVRVRRCRNENSRRFCGGAGRTYHAYGAQSCGLIHGIICALRHVFRVLVMHLPLNVLSDM